MVDTENRSWNFYILELASTNFFNPTHSILRVGYKGKFFDLRAMVGVENPSPADHLALVIAPSRTIDCEEVKSERLDYPPGVISPSMDLGRVPLGFAFLIDKRQRINTTNPQSGSAGMAISSTNMFDPEKVVMALSPRLLDRDYTTLKDNVDSNMGSIGLFVNRDGTVLLKSTGAAITLGKEGVHIGGRLFHESSTVDTGVLSDNTFADMIPSTIPTAGVAFPKLPNFGQIANIANAGRKFMEVSQKIKAGVQFANTVAALV